LELALDEDLSSELFYNLLANEQAKPNPLSIHLPGALQAAEHFEEATLVPFLYSDACVCH